MAIPALTIAGLSLKGRLAKISADQLWDENDDNADWDDLCVRKFIDAAIELAALA